MNYEDWEWADYFYPDTYDKDYGYGTLRNLYGLHNSDDLREWEYDDTHKRIRELRANSDLIDKTYDAAHLRAIHAYLFQDVYEWAGQYRTVDMGKGHSFFFRTQIDMWLEDAHTLIRGFDWSGLGRDDFADACAGVFARVNQAHPFREGNGRASKIFMEHVSELSCFTLNWARIPPDEWNQCSDISSMALSQHDPESAVEALGPLFYDAATPGNRPVHVLPQS